MNVTVIVTTLNEAQNLPRCLMALKKFDEIIVVDSGSTDETKEIAKQHGARVEHFKWNGIYPKKRQWCIGNLTTKHDYIFFVDADEQVSGALVKEITALNFDHDGYFVIGDYCWNGRVLSHGLKNNKLALFHKDKIEFPVIDDLGEFCMGEMEGHYQPVLKAKAKESTIGQLQAPLLHFAYEDEVAWGKRHERYAKWEAAMIVGGLYPKENQASREVMKRIFRKMPMRGCVAFAHSYFLKKGFMDGKAGYHFARSRYDYYKMVSSCLKNKDV